MTDNQWQALCLIAVAIIALAGFVVIVNFSMWFRVPTYDPDPPAATWDDPRPFDGVSDGYD